MSQSDKQGVAPGTTLRRAMDLTVTFILQVLGGCGAVWGCAEWLSIRGGPNNDNWRIISLIVGFVCFARWFMIQAIGDHRLDNMLATFLLQVCGAAGAIWGVAEILGSRVNYPPNCHEAQQGNTGTILNHVLTGEFTGPGNAWAPGYETCQNTYLFWRIMCGVVFLLFLCRWNRVVPDNAVAKFVDVHVGTFVLDVLGGAGAVWGCSEVFGPGGYSLRTGWGDAHFGQPSFDFWRIMCAPVFCLCLFAWVLTWQDREAAQSEVKQEGSEVKSQKVLELAATPPPVLFTQKRPQAKIVENSKVNKAQVSDKIVDNSEVNEMQVPV